MGKHGNHQIRDGRARQKRPQFFGKERQYPLEAHRTNARSLFATLRVIGGRIYGPACYTQLRIKETGRIYGPSGYTQFYVKDGVQIYGPNNSIPWTA